MLINTNIKTQYNNPYADDADVKNPFRDRLEGSEYLDVQARLERYTDTYDNSEYDSNPAIGIVDVMDSSGDASVGRNMRFHGDRTAGIYEETRFNSNKAGDAYGIVRLNFTSGSGKVLVTQAADRDGDRSEEFHRETVVNRSTAQIESVVER